MFNWWSIGTALLSCYFTFTSPTTMPKSAPALYSSARTSDFMHGSKGAALVSRLWQEPGELAPWGGHSQVLVSVITSWPRLSHRRENLEGFVRHLDPLPFSCF